MTRSYRENEIGLYNIFRYARVKETEGMFSVKLFSWNLKKF